MLFIISMYSLFESINMVAELSRQLRKLSYIFCQTVLNVTLFPSVSYSKVCEEKWFDSLKSRILYNSKN